jgi:hypothetical protein
MRFRSKAALALFAVFAAAGAPASGQLTLLGSFNSGLSPVGLGYDQTTESVWVYDSFGTNINRFSRTGVAQGTVARPGGAANDVDLEFTTSPTSLGGTNIGAGTLLYVDGESGAAEIYAVNPATGTVLATLNTAFGASHVVGGAIHVARGTLFLVQDKVPGAADENRIAEIDRTTGAVLNSFQITSTFSVNFGDIEVNPITGNLLVVSSDENRIAEYTPTGTLVQYLALPAGVTSLSGIGIDQVRNEYWVAGTGGTIYRLGAAGAAVPEPGAVGVVLAGGLAFGLTALRRRGLSRRS